jgi:polysaccharide deacetylase 2 family uncharacterized protein YibQ
MAGRAKTAKKKTTRGGKKSSRAKKNGTLGRILLLAGLLAAAVVAAAVVADFWLGKPPVPRKVSITRKPEGPRGIVRNLPPATNAFGARGKAALKPPVYEVYASKEPVPPPPRPPEREPLLDERPKIAIIIDDIGYDQDLARRLLAMDAQITFSVLPHSPHGAEFADEADRAEREILLHLPMEPVEYPEVDPGPGALFTYMDTDALLHCLEENLHSVPHVKGVNNHMGSRFTGNGAKLNPVFTALKKENLFFVDSLTTRASQCRASARLVRLPFAERDVFLDHEQSAGFVRRQTRELVRLARLRGSAIGIGHPHLVTVDTLAALLPEVAQAADIVPVSRLVKE